MSASGEQPGNIGGPSDEQLFDDIREFLSIQSGDRVYEELKRAYASAQDFVDRELSELPEYQLMLRGLERLVDDIFESRFEGEERTRLAEVLYLYGLAHYSLLQQTIGAHAGAAAETDEEETAAPLVIYDVWFPTDIAIERAQDGFYLHISDGRIDLSIYLGMSPNERGALVDLVDHWGYAASQSELNERESDLAGSVPMLTIEIDYNGSELVDAGDHVDVLFFDDEGEPVVRMHARAADLRGIIDELQAADREGGL